MTADGGTGSSARDRTLLVTSDPPEQADPGEVDPGLLTLFRAMMPDQVRDSVVPYKHQAKCFAKVLAGEEVALIAGTAAGKTLAIAVPLFHQVFQSKQLRKVVFVYPTRALLADQRRILQGLAAACGQSEGEIGEVRGGMTSAGLIHAMSKPVIVATPDALYWFFRKNVKFTMTLIYGLAQADAIVLDEAHLYTGLMQRNMWHFLQRLRHYRETYLRKPLRVHYLTATANKHLRDFSPSSQEISGRSKCTNVMVHLRAVSRNERSTELERTIEEALEAGGKRILVVANSARMAHQLFMTQGVPLKDAPHRIIVPDQFWEGFGLVTVGEVLQNLRELAPETAEKVEARIRDEIEVRPRDLLHGTVNLRAEYLGDLACQPIERTARAVQRILELHRRRHGEAIDRGALGLMLRNKGVQMVAQGLEVALERHATVAEALAELDERASRIASSVQQAIDGSDQGYGISIGGDIGQAVESLLPETGLTAPMRAEISWWVRSRMEINSNTVQRWEELDLTAYKNRPIALKRVLGWIDDASIRQQLARHLVAAAVRHSGVALAPDLPGVPLLILYTGSMARYAREGLIDLFAAAQISRPVILISTSAVEVGVDFAADVLITVECEGSSFLQRLGRVGRRPEIEAVAWVLVEPRTLASLHEALDRTAAVTRDRFMKAINICFPQRHHVETSRYADALQVLVSRQLGRTGKGAAEASDRAAQALADEIAIAGIEMEYGLRGTMPAVSLLDEGVTKDPFYILGYVRDKHVLPPSTQFEVASIDQPFNALVFAKCWRRICIRLQESLSRCTAIAVPSAEGMRIVRGTDGSNPAEQYAAACAYISKLPAALSRQRDDLLRLRHPLFADGGCDAPHLLLAYGPLLLGYTEVDGGDSVEIVHDAKDSHLELPEQWYLVLRYASRADEAWVYLEQACASGFENDVYYDGDRPISGQDRGMVLLDKQAGAVWEVWEKLRGQTWQG